MTTHVKALLLVLTLTFAFSVSATAQNSGNSTPTSPAALSEAQRQLEQEADEVKREAEALRLELRLQRLINEVKASRPLITAQREELNKADAQLTVEKQNSASLERSNALATKEIEHLRSAVTYQVQAIESKSETIGVLKERNNELKQAASKNRKRAFWATAAAVVLGSVLVLK